MKQLLFAVLSTLLATACANQASNTQEKDKSLPTFQKTMNTENAKTKDTATLGGGCFWCVEAVFQRLKGVDTVISGYMGGQKANPTYKEVCTGLSGHAEVIQIIFDPKVVSYQEILEVFWNTHDPTTLNRQGNDEGTQYRSAVFYYSEEQKLIAEAYKKQLDSSGVFSAPIVTEIVPAVEFYSAEGYHQDYYNQNGAQPYCQYVVRPKVEKFEKKFKDKMK